MSARLLLEWPKDAEREYSGVADIRRLRHLIERGAGYWVHLSARPGGRLGFYLCSGMVPERQGFTFWTVPVTLAVIVAIGKKPRGADGASRNIYGIGCREVLWTQMFHFTPEPGFQSSARMYVRWPDKLAEDGYTLDRRSS